MADASAESVLGHFDGVSRAVPEGTATPVQEAGKYFMRLVSSSGNEEVVEVARVIGSGRQHQVYLDASNKMMPLIWITVTRSWISSEDYQHAGVNPGGENYWRSADVVELGCMSCHLSQGRLRVRGKKLELEHTDLPINCESCHGPGRAHPYGDLHAISKEADVDLCARCHARKSHYYLAEQVAVETVALPAFRADGTQLVTGYQTAGHLLSPCFAEGAMRCSSCHEPHSQDARALDGESAEGKGSDKQCSVCHRNFLEKPAAEKHHRHGQRKIFCVDCHMPFTWMMDAPRLVQRVSDHSVSIPRPREALELGLPNACTTCHQNRAPEWALLHLERWGATKALEIRPWVSALAAAKQKDPEAPEELRQVVTSTAIEFARLSALDALFAFPPEPALVPAVIVFLSSEAAGSRALAYRALLHHDPAKATIWRDRGLQDTNALVRIETLLAAPDLLGVPFSQIEQVLRDLYAHDTLPPKDELEAIAVKLEQIGELAPAQKIRAAKDVLPSP